VKLENASAITSTNMRKYVATVSQLVDMNETEMGWLARHMGHDIHIHKEFYRMQESTLEIAVVGNLLLAIDEGRAHKFKGKNLRDIKIDGIRINLLHGYFCRTMLHISPFSNRYRNISSEHFSIKFY